MAIVEDASAPPVKTSNSSTSLTTASFSPPASSVLVAVVAGAWDNNVASVSISDSTGAPSWTLAGDEPGGGSFHGMSAIYYKVFNSAPGSMTVTANFTNVTNGTALSVVVLKGCNLSAPLGAHPGTSFTTAVKPYEQSVTPTVQGSRIYGAANINNSDSTSVTANANTTTIDFNQTGNFAATFLFKRNQASPNTNAVTLGGTIGIASTGSVQVAEFVPGSTTIGATFTATAPAAGFTSDASASVLAGMDATAPPASFDGTGRDINLAILDVSAPLPSFTAEGDQPPQMVAIAPIAQASIEGDLSFDGSMEGTFPVPTFLAAVETRVFGERVVAVPREGRTLKIPIDKPVRRFEV